MFFLNERVQIALGFFKILFVVFMLTHWIACIFLALGMNHPLLEEGSKTWVTVCFEGYEDVQNWEYYFTALYFAFLTLLTIGYGDITPRTKAELIFVMLIMIVACAVFAYIVGYIGSLIDKNDTFV